MPYPIVTERRLAPAGRKWLTPHRQLSDLPELPPGAVYVFQAGGTVVQFGDTAPLDLAHPAVTDAGTVAVVDLRSRSIPVTAPLPSRTPPEEFSVAVDFRCQVTDPRAVAVDGVTDIVSSLRRYLLSDRDLADIGRDYGTESIYEATVLVQDQVYARAQVIPPKIRGMTVEVLSVALRAPSAVERWQSEIVGLERSGAIRQKTSELEDHEHERMRKILASGAPSTEALAVVRGDVGLADVADLQRRQDEESRQNAAAVLLELLRQGHGKGSDFDVQAAVERFLTSGRGGAEPDDDAAIEAGPAVSEPARRPLSDGPTQDRPDYVPGLAADDD